MLKKNRLLILISLLLVFSFALAACGTTADEPVADEPVADAPAADAPAADAPAAEEPAERKVATFIWTQEFDSMSVLYTSMWFSTVTQQLWNVWPWQFDENNEAYPVLITEIPSMDNGGISEDGRIITMRLRDDVVWSDGEPLTANDFIFTYEMTMNPANTVTSVYPYDGLESIEAPDDQTLVMTFTDPFVPWLANLWHSILPEHVLRPVFEADGTLDGAEWNLAPTVGAGPYVFAEWESGSFARFVRNENYWGEAPKIDEIFFRFVPDDASQVAALTTGDGDLGTFIPWSDVPTVKDAGIEIIVADSGYKEGWFPLFMEAAHPALQDVRVRQAIAMAFDRFSLNEDLFYGETEAAATLWDDTVWVDPTIEPWPYDPDRARALLDEAGWIDTNGDGVRDKDGVELVLAHGTTIREVRQDAQAIAQQQMAEIGIQLDIQSFDSDMYWATYAEDGVCYNGSLDICEWSDAPYFPDPDHYYWLCSEIPSDEYPEGGNFQFLCDEELDALFQAQSSEMDLEKRIEMFHEISRIMFDKVYWLGLWKDPDVWAISSRLENTKFSGVTPFFNIMEWDLSN